MRPLTVLVVVALAVAMPACGGKKKSDTDKVKATWQSALKAVGSGDAAKLCSLVSPAAQKQLTASTHLSCEDTIKLVASRLSAADRAAAAHAAIRAVTVRGNQATISYATTPALSAIGLKGQVKLTKSGDTWLISGLS
jgi:hypothetical protein